MPEAFFGWRPAFAAERPDLRCFPESDRRGPDKNLKKQLDRNAGIWYKGIALSEKAESTLR